MMSRSGVKRVFPRRMLMVSARRKETPKVELSQSNPEIRIMENEIYSEQPFAPVISKVILELLVDFKISSFDDYCIFITEYLSVKSFSSSFTLDTFETEKRTDGPGTAPVSQEPLDRHLIII